MDQNLLSEIQTIIDGNQYMSGRATSENVVETPEFAIYLSDDGIKHVRDRHQDKYAPGSLFNPGLDYIETVKKISKAKYEIDGPKVKWIAVDTGAEVGQMGVAYADPAEVQNMKDYVMPDSRTMEKVKIAAGERKPVNVISLITLKVGKLSDGRDVLSMLTMFPGGADIDGKEIPANRSDFAKEGFYFVLPSDSPALS